MAVEKLPDPVEAERALSTWQYPRAKPDDRARDNPKSRAAWELATADWLYDLVRLNVARGRLSQLTDVLLHRRADCLGYATVLRCLGHRLGLDVGVVEVLIDNAGRYVPHHVAVANYSTGSRQFMDPWYGSRHIRHRRIGAMVPEGGTAQVRDLDWHELEGVAGIMGLSAAMIDGIGCYILGNRHLDKAIRTGDGGELDQAISRYADAVGLYPGYARAHFNRAIAYEKKGQPGEAASDYALALRNGASQIRVLATEHEEVTALMRLDEVGVVALDQEIYLMKNGFATGQAMPTVEIAEYYGISPREVRSRVMAVEAILGA